MVVLPKSWIFKIVIAITIFCFSVACLVYSEFEEGRDFSEVMCDNVIKSLSGIFRNGGGLSV